MSASLPITAVISDICTALETHHALVLEAPPGAGKTTAVPLALLGAPWRGEGKILVLEPRRVAARAAAERMAYLLGEQLGKRVGYRIRLESRVSEATVIEVITEGILTRWLQDDPELNGVAAVIFDEVHERSIHSDLGLALCLQSRELFRETPLKLVAMSATLAGEKLSELLGGAPIISSEGKSFPVDIFYGETLPLRGMPTEPVVNCIVNALQNHSGNGLVFLPGQREITAVQSALKGLLDSTITVLPLYGSLPFEDQQKALAPLPGGRKLVLATDIAETSLTIEGVTIVIDSGLTRNPRFDPSTGLTRLHTERVSRSSATQRAGRAGRLAAGVCYRLWTVGQQDRLAEYATPEILQADLVPLVLQLMQWGVNDPAELQWLDAPSTSAVNQAKSLLQSLGAIDGGQLTAHGESMARLPVHPRLAHMLLVSTHYNAVSQAANIAALVSDRCPLPGRGADVLTKLKVVSKEVPCEARFKPWLSRTIKQARQFCQLITDNNSRNNEERLVTPAVLAALAFPDRIAKRRDQSRETYLLANGRSAKLNRDDQLAGQDWLAVVETGGVPGQTEDIIYSALALREDDIRLYLAGLISQQTVVEWQGEKLIAEQRSYIGAIVLERAPLKTLSEGDVCAAACRLVRSKGLSVLPWTDELRQWQQRVLLLHREYDSHQWPNISDEVLCESVESWLSPYLTSVRKLTDFKRVPLKSLLEAQLPWPLPKQLNDLAPTHFKVPSGSSIRIDYGQSPPVLRVKLQEMFGCKTTPRIANSKVALLVHLLSPARRPLQITQDLEGFWNSSYQDVKKEMKGRYPKHPWPDKPWEAQATRLTNKRLNNK